MIGNDGENDFYVPVGERLSDPTNLFNIFFLFGALTWTLSVRPFKEERWATSKFALKTFLFGYVVMRTAWKRKFLGDRGESAKQHSRQDHFWICHCTELIMRGGPSQVISMSLQPGLCPLGLGSESIYLSAWSTRFNHRRAVWSFRGGRRPIFLANAVSRKFLCISAFLCVSAGVLVLFQGGQQVFLGDTCMMLHLLAKTVSEKDFLHLEVVPLLGCGPMSKIPPTKSNFSFSSLPGDKRSPFVLIPQKQQRIPAGKKSAQVWVSAERKPAPCWDETVPEVGKPWPLTGCSLINDPDIRYSQPLITAWKIWVHFTQQWTCITFGWIAAVETSLQHVRDETAWWEAIFQCSTRFRDHALRKIAKCVIPSYLLSKGKRFFHTKMQERSFWKSVFLASLEENFSISWGWLLLQDDHLFVQLWTRRLFWIFF